MKTFNPQIKIAFEGTKQQQIFFFSLELYELIPVDNFKENESLVLGKYQGKYSQMGKYQ